MSASASEMPVRFGFVLDQQVGLRTQAINLERVVQSLPNVDACFIPVHYAARAGLLTSLPLLPPGIRGTLRGVREIREGLSGKRLDAVLWATWAAKSVPDLVRANPSVIVMDMTPVQMEEMGALYQYSRARARLGGGWKRRATDRLYREARHLYPWSQFVADSLLNDYNVPAEKVTVVPPGVDLEVYCSDPNKVREGQAVKILFVGGDLLRKGGDLLLRWFKDRAGNRKAGQPALELHLVTRSPLPEAVPDGVHVYNDLTNNSPELVQLYRDCDIFALPTRADCYSLVALEAMASGLPVIISRVGGIADIVEEGKTGYLVPPDDYEGFTAALNKLVEDEPLRAAMGRAGRRRAEEQFDSEWNVSRLISGMFDAAGFPESK